MWRFSLIVLIVLPLHAVWKTPQGWMWYSPIPPKDKLEQQQDKADSKPLPPIEKIKKLQERFEHVKAQAILKPTLQNVQAVLKLQNQMVQQADRFKDMWMVASLLETTSQTNTNTMHLKLEKQQREDALDKNLKALAKNNGLFFMFKQDCPYCHAFAPVLKRFADTYGFEVQAISKDGSTLPEFPKAAKDNGWIAQLNPERLFPILFLVNPHTLKVYPLAKGMTSFSDLQRNSSTIIDHIRRTNHD